jgi:RNA polymerase sigma factor (sigma-70 family)
VTRSPRSGVAEEQFRRLFAENYRHVLAYALRRTRDHADANDVVAETFAVAWRRIASAPGPGSARPWLYAIARRRQRPDIRLR